VSLSLPTRPIVPDPAPAEPAEADTALLPRPWPESEPATDRLPRITAQPVFVDGTGRRIRRLRRVGALVGAACVAYLVVLTVAVGGGVVDPVTSGLPLSGAVAPLVGDPTTAATPTTSRTTTRSTATTRATARRTAAVVPATTAAPAPSTPAASATPSVPTSTGAPATATSAPAATSAHSTNATGAPAPETGTDDTDTATPGSGTT
jgi:hypothetical protein